MRARTVLAAAAALVLATAPAFAGPFPQHSHGPFHPGPLGGEGLVFGLASAVIAAGVAANSCVRYEAVYDAAGDYVGNRPVNAC